MDDISLSMMQLGARGYCCSQIMVTLALEARGRTCPDLVRSMAGLCHGLGDCSGPCGALTGGTCVLGLYAGKGSDEETEHERFPLMISELMEWFTEEMGREYSGTGCKDILGQGECGTPNPATCGSVVSRTFGRVMEILVENGLDPNDPGDFLDG